MKIRYVLLLLVCYLTACQDPATQQVDISNLPTTPSSFSKAKELLYETVHDRHATTFYCGCKYTSTNRVYINACGVVPRKNETRAKRLEAEHVFPASHFGQHRACWNQELCTDSHGKPYGGRRCCEKIDPVFEAAHNDLHNLQPSIGEINGDRSNRQYGLITSGESMYGSCDAKVDFETDIFEPPMQVRGDIARTYLYMRDTYNLNLSDKQTQLFTAWNRQDPVDEWEITRNERIKKIQQIGNHYISE